MTTKTYDGNVSVSEPETPEHYEELDTIWLEQRSRINVISQPLRGILGFFLTFGVFMAVWYVFMDPRGILKWYTPMYGYMYIRWLLIVAIWQAYIFNFWPFKRTWVEKTHPLIKGPLFIGINWAVTGLLVWVGFFWLIGKYSIPYFSGPNCTKSV